MNTFVNITFLVEPQRFDVVARWLSDEAKPQLKAQGIESMVLKICPVEEDMAPGIALQVRFPRRDDADVWLSDQLETLLERYYAVHGGESLAFHTILEEI